MGSSMYANAINGSVLMQACSNCTVNIINHVSIELSRDEWELIAIYRRVSIQNKLRLIQAAADIDDIERKGK